MKAIQILTGKAKPTEAIQAMKMDRHINRKSIQIIRNLATPFQSLITNQLPRDAAPVQQPPSPEYLFKFILHYCDIKTLNYLSRVNKHFNTIVTQYANSGIRQPRILKRADSYCRRHRSAASSCPCTSDFGGIETGNFKNSTNSSIKNQANAGIVNKANEQADQILSMHPPLTYDDSLNLEEIKRETYQTKKPMNFIK